VSMQRGGSSADTWVRTAGAIDTYTMLPEPLRPEELSGRRRPITSRAAENLFWMGRYAERADHSVRLARAALKMLGDDLQAPASVLNALGALCVRHGLVPRGVPSPAQSTPVFERTLIAALIDPNSVQGIAYTLAALARTGNQIRERLSPEHGRLILGAGPAFAAECAAMKGDGEFSSDEALAALARLAVDIAAITGAQADRMTRDDGWRLLTIGRQVERLSSLGGALAQVVETGAVAFESGFDLLLALFDSMITYRSLYQRRFEFPPLLDLVVREPANPRSLACVANVLRTEVAALAGADGATLLAATALQEQWPNLTQLCTPDGDGRFSNLLALTTALEDGAHALSDRIGERYFSHAAADYRQLSEQA
ncbi:MAG TPA: alpha-E domain-containing protein, partial [Burkholderiaceae bacterium]|nr:alpha-E domain-containing protein [Burkholderiaceae bacterium]